jgi:hypothetical protein
MSEPKTILRRLRDNVYEDVAGGLEPLFERSMERGESQYNHQSGYGYLHESRVALVIGSDPTVEEMPTDQQSRSSPRPSE